MPLLFTLPMPVTACRSLVDLDLLQHHLVSLAVRGGHRGLHRDPIGGCFAIVVVGRQLQVAALPYGMEQSVWVPDIVVTLYQQDSRCQLRRASTN